MELHFGYVESNAESPAGRKEFQGNKTKFTEEMWALLQGLFYLLLCFEWLTVMLSGEEKVVAIIWRMRVCSTSVVIFALRVSDLSGSMPFFHKLPESWVSVQKFLLTEFEKIFSGINIDVLWTSQWDPR